MAKTLNEANTQTESSRLNSAARGDAIRKAIRDIMALEAQRAGIGEDISEILQTVVKTDLGMKITDFRAILRVYKLEGDARDQFFDTLREGFAALGLGSQADFIDALAKDSTAADRAAEAEVDRAEAHNAGYKHGQAGKNLADCPYTAARQSLKEEFTKGYQDAQADLVEGMGKQPEPATA